MSTTSAHYVWEHPYYPQFYVPKSALLERIQASDGKINFTEDTPIRNDEGTTVATQCSLTVSSKTTDQILLFAPDIPPAAAPLANLLKLPFENMDAWLEESTPIHVHPKDPFKRIDILTSTRPVTISVHGHVLARTTTSQHLFETGLPRRFYIPFTALVDPGMLRPSTTRTKCPYKGEAEYWSVQLPGGGEVVEDLFWYYTRPTPECAAVTGLLCPYNERVDIELEGERLERPKTLFGKPKENKKPSAV